MNYSKLFRNKKTSFILIILLFIIVEWILYACFGHSLIEIIYEGRSVQFLNTIIEGQAQHPLEYYFRLADRFLLTINLYFLAILFIFYLFFKINFEIIFNSTRKTLLFLIILCILVRIVLMFTCNSSPSIYPDTAGYMHMASMMGSFNFSEYDGMRTPIYPLFVFMCRYNPIVIFAFQMLMGVGISIILFFTFRTLLNSNLFGFSIGMAHSLNLSQLLFEANILSETITTFFISLVVFLMFKLLQKKAPGYALIALLGLFASISALARPISLVLPAIVFLFLIRYFVRFWSVNPKRFFISLIAYLLPCCLLLGGWSYFNYKAIDSFSISTLSGLNLTHWSGEYIESAPAEYSQIKNIYAKYRDGRGTSKQTIWRALDELREKTSLTTPQLSIAFKKMSFIIITHHPKQYIKNVFQSWLKFWKPAFYHKERYVNKSLISITKIVIKSFNFIFLLAPIIWMAFRRFRKIFNKHYEIYFVYSIVIAISIIQAFLISVENRRYSIIIDSLIVAVGFYIIPLCYKSFIKGCNNINLTERSLGG